MPLSKSPRRAIGLFIVATSSRVHKPLCLGDNKMLIGLSLSYCVADIINGIVDKNEVAFIICGTNIRCNHDLEDVLNTYARYYWDNTSESTELGKSVAREFYNRGMLLQPRVLGFTAPHIAEGHWAKVSKIGTV
jgi:hypothetical protein